MRVTGQRSDSLAPAFVVGSSRLLECSARALLFYLGYGKAMFEAIGIPTPPELPPSVLRGLVVEDADYDYDIITGHEEPRYFKSRTTRIEALLDRVRVQGCPSGPNKSLRWMEAMPEDVWQAAVIHVLR